MWKTSRRSFIGIWMGKVPKWECLFCSSKARIFLFGTRGRQKNGCKEAACGSQVEEIDGKTLILMNPHHFLITYFWDVLRVNANRMKLLLNRTKMFESRTSPGAREKLPEWENRHAKTVAWPYDMEGHAQKCVERYCELTNKNGTVIATFWDARLTLQTRKLRLVGVATDRDARYLWPARV